MVDRIAYASILSNALISEVDLTSTVNSYVLEQSVALDSTIDVRLVLLREVDNLSVATTLEVEYAFVVPSMLVVTNQQTFGSVERVVLPVPDRPKKIAVFLPSMSVLAEQCIEAIPCRGR